MATNIPPPRKSSSKGEPPAKTETKENLSTPNLGKIVPLNFRVPAEFKKDFKIAAASHGITQSVLLQRAFDEWHKRHG